MIALSKKEDIKIKHEVFTGFRVGITLKVIIENNGKVIQKIDAGVGDVITINEEEFVVEMQDMIIELED